MTTTRLTASAISAVVRRAIGAGNAKVSTGSQIETDGGLVTASVTVSVHGAARPGVDRDALGRLVRDELLRSGYEVAASSASSVLTVVLPEPVVEEPAAEETVEVAEAAPAVEFRKVGRGLSEVVRDGVTVGRVAYESAYWWGYDLTGTRRTGGFATAREAVAALDERAPGITPEHPGGIAETAPASVEGTVDGEFRQTEHGLRYLTADEVAAEADEPATIKRYRAPSGNRDEDRFRAVHAACGWRSLAWHSNRTVEGRRIAEREAQQHRCPKPVVDEPVEEDKPGDPTINLGTRVAAVLAGSIVPVASITARQPGRVLVTVSDRVIGNPDRYESGSVINARAYSARGILARAGFRETPTGGDGVFVEDSHLMSDDLLDACGTAPQGRGLLLIPDTASERITCPACRLLLVEPGPEVDNPREEPRPVEWSEVAGV